MTKQPTILIPLNRGHFVRLMLYSGVIEKLADMGCHVVVLTPKHRGGELQLGFVHPNIVFDDLPLPGERLASRWNRVYRYLFQTMLQTSSSEARLEWMRHEDPRRYRIVSSLQPAWQARLRSFWIGLRRMLFPAKRYRPLFEKYRPDLVVVGTAGLNLGEYYLLRCAQSTRVRSLCALQSWDLFTTKGDLLERPEKMLVWNDANVQEAIRYFGYAPDDVRALGVPHFDVYFEPRTYVSREQWAAQYGFDPNLPVLLVTSAALHIHKNLPEVIQALADGMHNNRFVRPLQILIRPHPSVYLGYVPGHGTEADLQYFESLHPRIKGNRPQQGPDQLYDNSAQSEMRVLANNLFHASVVIDFYGTVSVEAMLVDTPVVYADVTASFAAITEQTTIVLGGINYSKYTHLKTVFDLKGARVAHNRGELYHLINQALTNPELDCEGRRRVAEAFCTSLDGRATHRVATAICQYAQGRWIPGNSA